MMALHYVLRYYFEKMRTRMIEISVVVAAVVDDRTYSEGVVVTKPFPTIVLLQLAHFLLAFSSVLDVAVQLLI